jgi:predicted aconitase with swiveling domain
MKFAVKRGTGPVVEGEALVSRAHFSPRYDLDREAGTFSRPGHPNEGEALAGKILFFPAVQGGVAGGWTFFELASRGRGPAGLVFGRTNPVMVQGAILAGIPVLDGLDADAFASVENGDVVRVDPAGLCVEITKKKT